MSHLVLSDLDLDAFTPGEISKAWLRLASDGLGQPIRIPLIVARGSREGPVAGITAALHGNEVNGVPVIHRLFRKLDPNRLKGTILAVPVANVPAYLLHQRRTDDGVDLNHVFPGRPVGREAIVYANRLFDRVIRKMDVLLDLHTASFGRVNSFYVRADLANATTAHLARLVGADIIVHNPSKDMTLRGSAENLGIPSITVEIGDPQIFDKDLVRLSRIGLRDILETLGMVEPDEEEALGQATECVRSYWLYTDTGGMLTVLPDCAARIAKGQAIARLIDPWGQVIRTYRAPEDGVVVGKSANPVARAGSRILHLGVPGPVSRDRAVPDLDQLSVMPRDE